MEIKKEKKFLFFVLVNLTMFYSCVMDYKPFSYSVRNCTNDTLLLDLTESDTPDGHYIFWNKQALDSEGLDPEYITEVDTDKKNIFVSNFYFALPDSTTIGRIPLSRWRTYYIYAIKWQVAKKYSIEEIRAKKLYDRRTVTKKDFHDLVYDYKIEK